MRPCLGTELRQLPVLVPQYGWPRWPPAAQGEVTAEPSREGRRGQEEALGWGGLPKEAPGAAGVTGAPEGRLSTGPEGSA